MFVVNCGFREGQKFFAKIKIENMAYEGEGWSTDSAFERVSVMILYGEFDQDATDLYNYYVRKAGGDDSFVLKPDQIRNAIKALRAKSVPKTAIIQPFLPENDSLKSQKCRSSTNSGSYSAANVNSHNKRDHSVGSEDANNSAKKPCTSDPRLQASTSGSQNQSGGAEDMETQLEKENEKLKEEIAHYEAELKIAKKQKELQDNNQELLLKLERFILNQILCVPKIDKPNDYDAEEKELKAFLFSHGCQFVLKDVSFDIVPPGFAKNYVTVEVSLKNGDPTLKMMFAGKGNNVKEASVHALTVVKDFVKRSIAFSYKLLGPSEDVFERLVKVLKYSNIEKVPFKLTSNQIFNLHEAALFHSGLNYKSMYSRTPQEAKIDVAKKVLRSMNYIMYGDASNLRLEV